MILNRAYSPVERRVELVGGVAESVQLGLGDRVDSRLQFPEGIHHFVLSSTQKLRPDAVGHGEAVFQSCLATYVGPRPPLRFVLTLLFMLVLLQQNPSPETKWLTAALRLFAADCVPGPGWAP